uniref:photosystem I assembly protein Ycf4 n=1 Tax=Symphyocladia marchantioides TaxID=88360 RepID=UPI0022FD5A45|nr:photosystem I assembly protein Ycf4 [Symphyocladia marchantioides]WAX03851.1 photosystem I assembly protein Ycf4 [Symphyocladia marchantioides]
MNKIKKDKILGSRRLSNYWWAATILIGGFSFFLIGIESYLELYFNNVSVFHHHNILFLPQGAVMIFYGMTGVLTSLFLWYTIIFDVGGGYNEFNHSTGIITIFRLGFPGKNRVLKLQYKIYEVSSIKINIQEGLSPKREIYLKTKDRRQIPLTKVGEPLSIDEIENKAKEIASFLKIKLEGVT